MTEFNFSFHLNIARFLTKLLDEYGLDPLIGVIPVVGDVVALLVSYYLVWIAKKARLPQSHINTMTRNIVADFLLGIIPVIGDVADFIFKANSKNLKILEEYAEGVVEAEVVI